MARGRRGEPDQAGVVPFRRKKDGSLRICLTHKPANGAWGIPKGYVDPGRTPIESALNEAWEEAGLHGRVVGDPVGVYEYTKWGVTLSVEIYLMKVTGQDDTWQEDHIRERHWLEPEKARRRIRGRPFAAPVRDALERLAKLD
jgi:8-oxo-dGTP pyrophosphatase MutT (NUDIX family)